MSKAAVAALTLALAEEVAGEGIWVNAVVPSTMDTAANRVSRLAAERRDPRRPRPRLRSDVIGDCPL